jgi:alpha-glucuronidase
LRSLLDPRDGKTKRYACDRGAERVTPAAMRASEADASKGMVGMIRHFAVAGLGKWVVSVALSLAMFPACGAAVTRVDEDGYDLWLRYPLVSNAARLDEYRRAVSHVIMPGAATPGAVTPAVVATKSVLSGDLATLNVAREELARGLSGLLGREVPFVDRSQSGGALVVGTPQSSELVAALPAEWLAGLGAEGYLIRTTRVGHEPAIVVAANTDIGLLYGAFRFLRQLQTNAPLDDISITSRPRIKQRILNHWDNLDRSVERGYAGRSLWEWDSLPSVLSTRYRDYARANASLGINGTVLTNVNANAQVLTPAYLAKVQALANVFRPYGLRVYLTARFSAPLEIGGLDTADPLAPEVRAFWAAKAAEIYGLIPDFGGFLVKANSEGQPGPQDYERTHADGANALADAVAPYGGLVIWRAFVYSSESPVDRIKQAYDEFKPLDGAFRSNVLVQAKNGALDFQPREPFHPLFGALPKTPLALELQITKEYLGQDTHLVFLGPLYEEVLRADTFAAGPGSTVAKVIDGSLHGYANTAIAGVSNVGTDRNWTGSQFNQANWYVFGRMAWDPDVTSAEVAQEWVRATFSNEPRVVSGIEEMLLASHQAVVDYMTPLGLVHIMATGHHYGPGPWVSELSRPEWNPTYYHRADAGGIGFDRTASGSDAVAQYFSPVRQGFADRASVPDAFLLFFHHVGWQETMHSGRTLWDELVHRYSRGVSSVREMRDAWSRLEGEIDRERFEEVAGFLDIQADEARWWRDAALTYFQQFSKMPIPPQYEQPALSLAEYQALSLTCPADRDKPRCPPVYLGR